MMNSLLVSLLVVTVPIILAGCAEGGTVEGIVDHKVVTGVKNDTANTILIDRPGDGEPWILPKDEDYEEYFSTEDENLVVSESLEGEMKKEYAVVNYFVNVRIGPEEEGTQPYTASREIFNKIRVGTKVKFRWSGPTQLPEIVELLTSGD